MLLVRSLTRASLAARYCPVKLADSRCASVAALDSPQHPHYRPRHAHPHTIPAVAQEASEGLLTLGRPGLERMRMRVIDGVDIQPPSRLLELAGEADWIVFAVPETKDTRGMLCRLARQ